MLYRYQLQHIATDDLIALRDDIRVELASRRHDEAIEKRRKFISSLRPKGTSQFTDDLARRNASAILKLPSFDGDVFHRISNQDRYLPWLLEQPWSLDIDQTPGEFYVYAHVAPSKRCIVLQSVPWGNMGGLPFYIGKGCGPRAFDLKRNQAHGKKIRSELSAGFEKADIVKIIFEGLSSSAALDIERKLIYFFGTAYDDPPGPLVNLDANRPMFDGQMTRIASKKQREAA